LTVTAVPLTASIIGDPTKTYDGTTSATLTQANFSLSGLVGTQSFTVTQTVGTYNSKDVSTATTVTASLSAGNFTPGSGTLASDYTLPTTASGAGNLNPALLTVTAANESMTYGGMVPALTYTYTGLVNGDNSATFSGDLATTATSAISVGGYAITQGNLVATGNYTIGTFNAGTLMVTPAPLIITPTVGQSMVYGGTVPALTYTASGFVNDDPASLLTGALGTTATSTSVVGDYLFTLGSLIAGTNYALALAADPPAFAVTQATPTITWANPGTITYGTALSATQLDATASWTVGGNTVNVPGSFTYNPAAGTVLSAGNNQTLSVSFTPTDTSDYTNARATTSINVTQHATATTTAMVASTPEGAPGQTITFTATVASVLPSPYLPTGSV
jgi:hypothetical protein